MTYAGSVPSDSDPVAAALLAPLTLGVGGDEDVRTIRRGALPKPTLSSRWEQLDRRPDRLRAGTFGSAVRRRSPSNQRAALAETGDEFQTLGRGPQQAIGSVQNLPGRGLPTAQGSQQLRDQPTQLPGVLEGQRHETFMRLGLAPPEFLDRTHRCQEVRWWLTGLDAVEERDGKRLGRRGGGHEISVTLD